MKGREEGWVGWHPEERVTVVRETDGGSKGPRGNIFTSLLSFRSLFRLYGVVALPPSTRSLLSPIENAPRQMKIYRSGCPVGGFNLICHTVVARDCQGAVPRNKEGRERVWVEEKGSKRVGTVARSLGWLGCFQISFRNAWSRSGAMLVSSTMNEISGMFIPE